MVWLHGAAAEHADPRGYPSIDTPSSDPALPNRPGSKQPTPQVRPFLLVAVDKARELPALEPYTRGFGPAAKKVKGGWGRACCWGPCLGPIRGPSCGPLGGEVVGQAGRWCSGRCRNAGALVKIVCKDHDGV